MLLKLQLRLAGAPPIGDHSEVLPKSVSNAHERAGRGLVGTTRGERQVTQVMHSPCGKMHQAGSRRHQNRVRGTRMLCLLRGMRWKVDGPSRAACQLRARMTGFRRELAEPGSIWHAATLGPHPCGVHHRPPRSLDAHQINALATSDSCTGPSRCVANLRFAPDRSCWAASHP
jgi:hypothetical protein